MTDGALYQIAEQALLSFNERKPLMSGTSDVGYITQKPKGGAEFEMSFSVLVSLLRQANSKIDEPLVEGAFRLKGLESHKCASREQNKVANFKVALCVGVERAQESLRDERGNPDYNITEAELNRPKIRKLIKAVAEAFFGPGIEIEKPRGGRNSAWVMFRGRVLKRDFLQYMQAKESGEDPLDALIPLDHLKGNRGKRIPWELRELMTHAFEKEGATTRHPSSSNVMSYLKTLIWAENKFRQANGLSELMVPSLPTLNAHIKQLLTQTELDIIQKGKRQTQNSRGRGSTDYRALLVGEYVEIDECRLSLLACAKKRGIWEKLSDEQREILEEIDDKICSRYTLVVVIDVASGMPLAWVLTEHPNTEATLEALRMATRDKTREKDKYGCCFTPMPAMRIGHIKNDNGTALRNRTIKQAILGIGAMNTDARVGVATDKPYVERLFGTTESRLLKLIDGYTGRKAGDMKEYDANAQALLVVDELYAEISRFMIDDYPAERHYGHGMFGCRPREMYAKIEKTRGIWKSVDPTQRRLALGWAVDATPNDEGVRVFGGVWFNSPELQEVYERFEGKVTVHIDPDDLQRATVTIPGHPEVIEVYLQSTVFAGMTLTEVFDFMIEARADDLETTEFYEDHLNRVRSEFFARIRERRKQRNISGSFTSREEAKKLAKQAFSSVRVIGHRRAEGAAEIKDLTRFGDGVQSRPLGRSREIIEQRAGPALIQPGEDSAIDANPDEVISDRSSGPVNGSDDPVRGSGAQTDASTAKPLARPKNVRTLK